MISRQPMEKRDVQRPYLEAPTSPLQRARAVGAMGYFPPLPPPLAPTTGGRGVGWRPQERRRGMKAYIDSKQCGIHKIATKKTPKITFYI
jgi:hypothetical protein